MVKEELVERSPLRIFHKTIHGGLQNGCIGVITSKEGVGKTACLVHIAIDKMLQGKQVIHVSFAQKPDNILNWYENIFSEIAKDRGLDNAKDVHDELVTKRVVISFPQGGVPIPTVLKSVETMVKQAQFNADTIIIDSLDFDLVSTSDLQAMAEFAKSVNMRVWISVSLKGEAPYWDENGIPFMVKPFLNIIEELINVRFDGDYIHLELVKDRDQIGLTDMNLKLDPKTLLIAKK